MPTKKLAPLRVIQFVIAPNVSTVELDDLEKQWNSGRKIVKNYHIFVKGLTLHRREKQRILVTAPDVPYKTISALRRQISDPNIKTIFTNYHVNITRIGR